jgi:hypothetical protein
VSIQRGLYRMVALNGLQVNETTDGQALLVAFSLIKHSENMLGENSALATGPFDQAAVAAGRWKEHVRWRRGQRPVRLNWLWAEPVAY